jgi:hypothetical protein
MIRRKPVRERFGEASFGRRKPHINTAQIRAEISTMKSISALTNSSNDRVSNIDLEIDALLNHAATSEEHSPSNRRPLARSIKRWK